MSIEKSRSKEQIFSDMHRELRRWNPSVSESVDRLDPVLKILIQLYAHQLERIDKRIDQTWEVSINSLIKSLVPESKKWPVPAFTIMKCAISDPVVEIDEHTRFFYKEKREGGKTFFFSSQKQEKLIAAEVRHLFVRFEDTLVNLMPSEGSVGGHHIPDTDLLGKGSGQVYAAVEYGGMPSALKGASLYLAGPDTVLRQLQWGHWYPGSNFGGFHEDSGYCPGLAGDVEALFAESGERVDWGGLRSSSDLFDQLGDNFVILPDKFTSTWELGPTDPGLCDLLVHHDIDLDASGDRFYWIRIDLPPGGNKLKLKDGFNLHFNCFVATNKNELSTYKYTGGNKLVEVEVPEELDNILGITSVVDSRGDEYLPRHKIQANPSQRSYALEERNNHLVLWFDFSTQLEAPPDYVTVNYAITAGVAANGISAGQVSELYEKHPGVSEAENIVPVLGAIPAKTEAQIMTEVSARLRNRDRVLSFEEIASWTKAFDPRINKVECDNSVQRIDRGVRRCIRVRVQVGAEDFYSDDEATLLQRRLNEFLRSRSAVNSTFVVEIIRR